MDFEDQDIEIAGVPSSHKKSRLDIEWEQAKNMYEQDGIKFEVIANTLGFTTRDVIIRAKNENWTPSALASMAIAKRGLDAIPTSEIISAEQAEALIIAGNTKHLALGSYILDDAVQRMTSLDLSAKEITAIAQLMRAGKDIFDQSAENMRQHLNIETKADKQKNNNGGETIVPFFSGGRDL